ncbi:MAG: hypothetical protein IJR48_01535 [Oscillibacter sp.]|nr:hypothetical protein [Oscillibacter sp.]MBQ7681681.1 hypothetical protein [Oscillibacter sp.]MBQ9617020.1 hypothetical protein [Oscillibacter sp.]
MSISMNGVGYTPTTQAIQAAQTARQNAAPAESAEAKSEQKQQVDTYEPSSGRVSYQMDTETVNQLKADLEQQKSRFLTSVKEMLGKQGVKVAEGDGIWKQIAQGKFQVDDETRAAAKDAISEDGYWGVKQTSERFIKYAKALTGGDPAKAEAMREAFQKGYKEAEKAWGGSLPELSQKTYDATMKLFDDWANEAQ